MQCKICSSPSEHFGAAKVMGKYSAEYRRCPECGLVFVASPTWLAESYKSAINRTDLGTVSRADENSRITKAIIELCLKPAGRCVDYGAGYGVFVRQMRDIGYDFWAYDQYCENLFAEDFQVSALAGTRFSLATSYEVFEHLEDPVSVFAEIFEHCDALLFTTELIPASQPKPGDWYYYGLDHGQHITFFTTAALEFVARTFSRHLCSDGWKFHLLSARPVSAAKFRLALNQRFNRILEALHRRPSLLPSDFQRVHQTVLDQLGRGGG